MLDAAGPQRVTLLLQEEESWGVPLSEGAVPRLVEFTDESLGVERRYTGTEHFIDSGRAAGRQFQGRRNARGTLSGLLMPRGGWPILLKHAIGGSITTTGLGPYLHTMAAGETLPPGLTVEKQVRHAGGEEQFLRYPGCRVDTCFLRVTEDGQATVRVNLLAKDEIREQSGMQPPAEPPATSFGRGARTALQFDLGEGSVVAAATEFEFTIFNNLNGQRYDIIDNGARSRLAFGARQISGSFSTLVTPQNWAMLDVLADDAEVPLDVTIRSGESNEHYRFRFPAVQLRGPLVPRAATGVPMRVEASFTAHSGAEAEAYLLFELVSYDEILSTAA